MAYNPVQAETPFPFPTDRPLFPSIDHQTEPRPRYDIVPPPYPLPGPARPEISGPLNPAGRNQGMFVNQQFETKHPCGVCGRYRSPAYHHRHPIPSGQALAIGVCHKCRDLQTSSDESSSESIARKRKWRGKRNRRNKNGCNADKNSGCLHYHDQEILRHGKRESCPVSSDVHRDMNCLHNAHSCHDPKKPCDIPKCCFDIRPCTKERHIHHAVYTETPPRRTNYGNSHVYSYQSPPARVANESLPADVDLYPSQFYPPRDRQGEPQIPARVDDGHYRGRERRRRSSASGDRCRRDREPPRRDSGQQVQFTDNEGSDSGYRSRSYNRRRGWRVFSGRPYPRHPRDNSIRVTQGTMPIPPMTRSRVAPNEPWTHDTHYLESSGVPFMGDVVYEIHPYGLSYRGPKATYRYRPASPSFYPGLHPMTSHYTAPPVWGAYHRPEYRSPQDYAY
ncbi:hypothetical protein CPC735_039420 [Coccidioides posadasii C735 delta SOWgp]|nr:hypothetical protein CPC735_039420 [Coccidioides posadasii C735 delta SOWgp]EER28678.1 hypothetical protein CPC735_039420 [Coccidioides posadasii C735 delta SOWgp]|eukprot:XP_003070823.1 hypothetical protein CPC735_039420 [Coccidioides posadasii C735 delta SOWgp]